MQTIIQIFDEHSAQCEKILTMLSTSDFVPTKDLIRLGIYQYNARIYDLRNGKFDGFKHGIQAVRENGVCGFTYPKGAVWGETL